MRQKRVFPNGWADGGCGAAGLCLSGCIAVVPEDFPVRHRQYGTQANLAK